MQGSEFRSNMWTSFTRWWGWTGTLGRPHGHTFAFRAFTVRMFEELEDLLRSKAQDLRNEELPLGDELGEGTLLRSSRVP